MNTRIMVIPVKECIPEKIFQRLWRYGMRVKTEDEATEENVAEWIKSRSKVTETFNFLEIERNIRKKVQININILSMEDRLETLLGNFTDHLLDLGVCERYLEHSPAQAIKLLQSLLEQKAFKDQVRKDLEMGDSSVRENWYEFVVYILDKAKDMDKVHAYFVQEQEKPSKPGQHESRKQKSANFRKQNQEHNTRNKPEIL